jgi:hypothetical protein
VSSTVNLIPWLPDFLNPLKNRTSPPSPYKKAAHIAYQKRIAGALVSVSVAYLCTRCIITDMIFEWDAQKNLANKEKHGIDFETAKALWA